MPSATETVEDRLRATILAFMHQEIAENGVDESGLEFWYKQNYVDRNDGFAPYGYVIADFLEPYRQNYDRIVEIGAGIGQNCIQLSARGWHTTALESWGKRHGMMVRLLERVGEVAPAVKARIQPLAVRYPDNAVEYLGPRTIAMFASLVGSFGGDAEVARLGLSELRRAGGLVLDLRVFLKMRERPEQEILIQEIQDLGFQAPITIWDWGGESGSFMPHRFVFFQRALQAS